MRRGGWIWLTAWLVGFVGLSIGFALVPIVFYIQGFAGMAAYTVAGLWLVTAALHPRLRTAWLTAPVVAGVAIGLFLGFSTLVGLGYQAVGYMQFRAARPVYDDVVHLAEGGSTPAGPYRGVRFDVEPGPPVRVAFPIDGIGDNWTAVIHDPSDRVASAHGWADGDGVEYTVAPDLQELFGGDLLSCRHLEDHYYRCSFT